MIESYYHVDSAASYGGVSSLAREFGTKSASNWLKSQDAYTLHKPLRKKFPRRRTFAKGINDLFQADLADMQNLSQYNDGHRYILTCIDVFSKRAFALAIKDKRGKTLAASFEEIFSDTVPNMIQTDRGVEFLNTSVQAVFKKYNIHHYWSLNDDIKAACVERFNRTLKTRLYRYFTAKHTNRWIDVLQSLINSYNKSFHRTIGMTPNDVTSDNAQQVAERMYPQKVKPKFKFHLGDNVRITIYKHIFVKGYTQNWTNEVYTVTERHESNPPTYTIRDLADEEIKGRFYEQELQKVVRTEEDEYIVEKVLKTRKRNGKLEHYVKWNGYGDKFNSWTTSLRKL
jgi:Integrase core domain/Chromo (CHRromatin Organisation MOdifier) domain